MTPGFPDLTDRATTHLVATGAIVSPMWLDHLSGLAATALPILGCLWLLIQAAVYLYQTFWKAKPK